MWICVLLLARSNPNQINNYLPPFQHPNVDFTSSHGYPHSCGFAFYFFARKSTSRPRLLLARPALNRHNTQYLKSYYKNFEKITTAVISASQKKGGKKGIPGIRDHVILYCPFRLASCWCWWLVAAAGGWLAAGWLAGAGWWYPAGTRITAPRRAVINSRFTHFG